MLAETPSSRMAPASIQRLAAGLLVLGLAACDSAEDAGPPTVIEGTVTYQGQPLPDMGMGISGTNGTVTRPLIDVDTTDASGRFRLESFSEAGGAVTLEGWDIRLTTGEYTRYLCYFPNTAERYYERGQHHTVTVEFELADRED